ncbi:MAG: hypothetical protein ACN4EF_05875 [Wenyingzhuangia sp.]|jgi:hypothetical protein|uniref:hypothetical protein n=1 Tax=Wenyingzhuangia sp. TaxID=1964193 RepID=UPI00321A8531
MKPIFYQILFFFCFCSSYAQTKDKPKVLDAKIENTQQTKEEKYTRSIPSKYFMTNSAIPLKKNTGYYSNTVLAINSIQHGISDYISVGFSYSPLFVFDEFLFFTHAKASLPIAKYIFVSAEIKIVSFPQGSLLGLGLGTLTFGDHKSNLSFSATHVLEKNNQNENSSFPRYIVSGTHKINRVVSFITENFLSDDRENHYYYSGIHGIRLALRKNALDIGAFTTPFLSGILALPYVSYTVTF